MEPTDIVVCAECGRSIQDQNGIIIGDRLGHDEAVGICKSCLDTAHYLLHRKEIDKSLTFSVDEFYHTINVALADGLKCVIFDIDGTLCDEKLFNLVDDRSKQCASYFPEMAEVAMYLAIRGIHIVYLSARLEKYRSLTEYQLYSNHFPVTNIILYEGDENDTDYVATTTTWKNNIVLELFNEYSNMLIVDDNRGFLGNLETFIYPRDVFNIIDLGRCSVVTVRYNGRSTR